MTSTPRYDAVVVGSGFGGSINALRLARSGRSVLVLERGRRIRPGEFPRDVSDVERLFWRYPRHPQFRGLFDVRFFSALGAVVASGVGGGSLIYANIHIRPDAEVFEDPRWPASVNRLTLQRHYDTVGKMLNVSPVPSHLQLPKRTAFADAATRLGHAVFDPDEAVKWEADGSTERSACRLCAQCEFGCQFGAKSTLDLTYLAEAERLGAIVRPNAYVTSIQPVASGYQINFRDTGHGQGLESVLARRVVVSAGTLGTNELLLRCRDRVRTLPRLSARLGHGYSANGDFLGSIVHSRNDLQPWHGTDVTSVIRYPHSTHAFTMAAPTFSRPVMTALAAIGQPRIGWLRGLSPLLWRLGVPLLVAAFRYGLIGQSARHGPPTTDAAHMTNLFAIGRDNASGQLHLRGDRLDVRWHYRRENLALISAMRQAMQALAVEYGGTFAPIPTWTLFQRIITVHSLGGCHLSESSEQGVVSPVGEVHGYPGLFIADGSVIPSSIGFHPAMTIAAVSEHIAESVVASL